VGVAASREANCCYQLAWQSFDLAIAYKLNIMGNEHTAKARELRSQEERQTQIHAQRKNHQKMSYGQKIKTVEKTVSCRFRA